MRQVVFYIQDKNCGASFMLGTMVKHGLDHFKIPCSIKYVEDLLTIKDSLVIIFKHQPPFEVISVLKENNNKIVMDVVDEFIRPGTTPQTLYDYEHFDGIIIRVGKILTEYKFPEHLVSTFIPHHWDIRLQNLTPPKTRKQIPTVTINDGRDMPYLHQLLQNKNVEFTGNFSYSEFSQLIERLNEYSIHYNVRSTNSLAYKFKPATKLVTASAYGIPLITNYDWAVEDLIPSDYPFLTEGKTYEEIVELINKFPSENSKEYKYAMEILHEVKVKTALINLVPQYEEFYKKFN